MKRRVTLKVMQGPMVGREFVFTEHDAIIVGRDKGCHVRLSGDPCVSRHHALFEVCPPQIQVRDLQSANGTFVVSRGQDAGMHGQLRKVEEAVELAEGDEVHIGNARIQVVEIQFDASQANTTETPSPQSEAEGCPCTLDEATEMLTKAGYSVEVELGKGGMGTVYLAVRGEASPVAVKMISSKSARDSQAAEKFMREMETLQSLVHPNIVTLFRSGSINDILFFEMEYCNFGNAAQLAKSKGGKLKLRQGARIILECLRGLAYAHERRIVHRDIKPQNILLHNADGANTAKLCDFGLAKNFEKAGLSGMTATGQFGGSIHFMPRDQLLDYKYAKPAADVWSVAATLYYLLSAKYPRDFTAYKDPVQAVLEADIVPLRERETDIPEPVAAVVDRALVNEASERYPDALEFGKALKKALRESSLL